MKYLKTLERFSNLVEKKNAELKSIYKSLLKEAKEAGIEDEIKEAEDDEVKEADQSFAEDEISAADFFKECDEKDAKPVEECDEKSVEEADGSKDEVDEAEDDITAEEFFSDSEDTEEVDETEKDEKDVDEAKEKVDEDDILKGRNHNGHLKETAKKEAPKKAKKLAEAEDDKAVEEDEKEAEATDEAEEWMNADEFFAPLKNEKEDTKVAAEDVDEEENVEEDDITEADFFEEDDAEEEIKEDDNEEVNEDDFGKGRLDLTAAVDSGKVKPRFNNHDLSTIKGTIANCLKKHVAEFTPEVMQNPDHAVEVIKGWFDEDGIDTPDSRKYLALIGNKDPRSKFRGPNNKKNVDNIIRYLTNIYLKGAGCGLGNRFHETEEVEEDDKQVAESLKMYRNMNKHLFEC